MAQDNTVTFNSILVNSISTNSGIFVGSNLQNSWNSNGNHKSGFGNVIGNGNIVSRGVNIFMDNDFIDTPIITGNYSGLKQAGSKELKDNIKIYGCRSAKRKRCSSLY
ncbi:MAG TPA: hypothetical protein VN580_05910 [Clostridia bacterium]|nr:hypothetical protein [Clostridia bacterium]